MALRDFQQRVVIERKELRDRLGKLEAFTQMDTFKSLPGDEQARMRRQMQHMSAYADVLDERIAAFPA
jgi:hypothetical protein